MPIRHILTIDGGGVRGLVSTIVLEALQDELKSAGKNEAIGNCFDLIAGTSSGALIAAGLAFPAPDGGAGPTPSDLRTFFETQARTIFPSRPFCNIPIVGRLPQLFGPLHDPAPFKNLLDMQFGDMVFASARRNVMITAYSIDPRDILLFRGGPAYEKQKKAARYEMVRVSDAVLGSSAAPTFFPPHRIESTDQISTWTAIDGGVFLNDPAMAAYTEALRLFPGDEIRVVSLGTGRQTRNYPFERARNWGFSQWVSPTGRFRTPLISAIQDGQARTVNRQLDYLLGAGYYRFDYRLEKGRGSDKLDDASKRNLKRLALGAREMVEDMRGPIRELAQSLSS